LVVVLVAGPQVVGTVVGMAVAGIVAVDIAAGIEVAWAVVAEALVPVVVEAEARGLA
jgi:hypothetical protein